MAASCCTDPWGIAAACLPRARSCAAFGALRGARKAQWWGPWCVSHESISAGYLARAPGSTVRLQRWNKGRTKRGVNLRLLWAVSFRPSLNHKLGDVLLLHPSWILKAAWRSSEEWSSITGPENDYCGKALLGLSCCQWSIIVLSSMSVCCWTSLLFCSLSLRRHGFLLKALKIYSVPWPGYSRWGNRFSHSAGWVFCFFKRAGKGRGKKRKTYTEQQENWKTMKKRPSHRS